MQQVQVFSFKGANVRTVRQDGQPWWVASDVASILDLKGRSWLRRLLDSEKGVHRMDTLGGMQHVTVINETGLYKAIMRSDKEQAQAVQHWIAAEVLPSIRKTGGYVEPGQEDRFAVILSELQAMKAEQARPMDAKAMIAASIAQKLELLSPAVQKIVVTTALALPPEVQAIWTATQIASDLAAVGIIASPQKVGATAKSHGIQCPKEEQENEYGYWAETTVNNFSKVVPQFIYRKPGRDRLLAIFTAAHTGFAV